MGIPSKQSSRARLLYIPRSIWDDESLLLKGSVPVMISDGLLSTTPVPKDGPGRVSGMRRSGEERDVEEEEAFERGGSGRRAKSGEKERAGVDARDRGKRSRGYPFDRLWIGIRSIKVGLLMDRLAAIEPDVRN